MRVKLSTPKRSMTALIAAMGLTAVSAFAQSYPAPALGGPSSSYTFPAAFSPFAPPVSADAAAAGTPAIAEWTRINDPGDTMVITGENLSRYTGVSEGRDSRFAFFGQSGASTAQADGMVQRLSGREVAVQLPASLPANEMYFVWALNENGAGEPVAINQTEAWWAGPSETTAGEQLSVYGRNLALGNGKSYLYIEELNQWLTSVSENPVKADFVLPNTMANGTYTIWAHNGHGQKFGWASKLTITVISGINWNAGNTINVKNSPYNAKGNGSNDDATAINNALADAKTGDTVYLPAGTYLIGSRLRGISGHRLMGAGMDQTVIKTHSSFAGQASGTTMVYEDHGGDYEVRDMTFNAGNYLDGKVYRARSASHVRVENVRFTQLDTPVRTDLVDVAGAKYSKFVGCEFYPSRNVFVGGSRQVAFENCDWYGIYDCNVLLSAWGADELSITGCSAQHYDSSDPTDDGRGWCQGRFLWGSGHGGTHRDIYFGSNSINNMHPRFDPRFNKYEQNGRMNTGEHVMFEWTATFYEGNPLAATATTLKLGNITEDLGDKIAVITSGKGVGQSRYVKNYNASTGTVTLENPWRVVPDTGSTVVLGNYVNQMAVYGNFFDGHERLMDTTPDNLPTATNRTATTAVSVYGAFQNLVVADNTIQQTRQGIISWGFGYDKISPKSENNLQPNYFNIFAGNSIDSCYDGIVNVVATFNSYANSPGKIIAYNTWRKNRLTNISDTAVVYHATYPELPIGMCVFQDNTASKIGKSVSNSDNLMNQVWVGNAFDGGGTGTGISFSDGHIPALHNNVWTGFNSVYGSAEPGPVLELPTRALVVGKDATSVSVPVVNSGNDALSWNASSSESWLKVSTASGTVANEQGTGTIAMSVDTAAVAAGSVNPAVVTVQANGQTKQMTFAFDANAVTPPPPTNPPAPVLGSISISGPAQLDEGTSALYSCTATYSDGSSATVDPVWSEDSAITSIDASGRLTAGDVAADQNVTLLAVFDGKTNSFALTVSYVPPFLSRIEIAGPNAVVEGNTAQYGCTAHYSDGSTLAVNPSWSESSSVASISSSGLLAAGNVTADTSVTISASFGGKTDTYALTVSYIPPTLTGLAILGSLSVDEETTAQFSCVGSFSDGTTALVTPSWSENSPVASISSAGLLTAGNVASSQTALITATLSGLTATHSITIKYVPPYVTSILISGSDLVNEESSVQYTCESVYSDGSRKSIDPVWSVSAGTATISAAGVLTTGNIAADQAATVTATFNGKTANHNLTIAYVAPTVTGISISGPAALDEGTSASYACIANYSDGTTGAVTPVWSDNVSYVNINASGLLTAGDVATDRSATLTATLGGHTASQTIVVRYVAPPVTVTGISISAPVTMDEISTATLTCTASYSDGTTGTVDPAWSVDNAVASISPSGLLSVGNIDSDSFVLVSASYGGQSASHSIGIWSVGTQVIYPLTGFEGRTVRARLWDETEQVWIELGEMVSPQELIIENVVEDQWYWINVEELNQDTGKYEVVHASWISM